MAWMPENTEVPGTHPPYVVLIDETDVEQGLKEFKALGLDGDAVSSDNFPLPKARKQLEQAGDDIHNGRGFAVIRGVSTAKYTVEDNVTIFLGIASYIGSQRGVQDRRGNMLTHVTDSKAWSSPHELRHGIHTNTGLAWHTDMGADILALHVRALAQKGGATFVASSWTIYRELMMSHPEILTVLSKAEWPIQISGNPPRHILAPLLQVFEDKIYISVDPGRLGVHPVTARSGLGLSIPDLTPLQHEALAVLSRLASKFRLCLDIIPGDMVFINNWSILHARDSYIDPEDGPRRHIVRLWCRNPTLGWDIPDSMRVPWEAAFGPGGNGHPPVIPGPKGDLRGGVEKKYQVVPTLEYKAPKFTAGSAAFILEDSDDVNGDGEDTAAGA
ncbi:hypothetical protein B0T17DRAFT_503857 [Bombardia bombarda]|uniref:TauD/TfdA-like domain-containing protein n=1 Tax=Bombardia bombarda TaxID=252184 RepID=A0AA39XMM8_9PEZI|nr:hypothetical protein B0T17DRAFT_503857 [Bombardia bombarda]